MKNEKIKIKKSCRACSRRPLTQILSLGELYVSDFLDPDKEYLAGKAPLDLVLCESCGLLQLKHTVSHESLYRNYWYRSGVNKTMAAELQNIAEEAEKIVSLKSGDFVLDIGSNDGTLLRSYTVPGLKLVGFEPARNIVEKHRREGLDKIFVDFFNFPAWQKEFGGKKAKIINAIAMFYDLDDPNTFIADVVKCLDREGLFIIQMAYLPLILKRNAFDGMCHEHLEYYTLLALESLLMRHGLEVFNVEPRDINEGSFRTYIRRSGGGKSLRIPEGAEERVKQMREAEAALNLMDERVYRDFAKRVDAIRDKVRNFIESEVRSGKKIYVYGASTKGNTLLQYFGLDNHLIVAAAERNPDKWGKRTVGTNIPIISEEEARKAKPDYFLVLPWHFIKEFMEREEEFLKNGGRFIVPLPEFRIVK